MGPNKVYDPQSEVFELKFTSDTITLPTAWMSHFNENEDTTKKTTLAKLKLNTKNLLERKKRTRKKQHKN